VIPTPPRINILTASHPPTSAGERKVFPGKLSNISTMSYTSQCIHFYLHIVYLPERKKTGEWKSFSEEEERRRETPTPEPTPNQDPFRGNRSRPGSERRKRTPSSPSFSQIPSPYSKGAFPTAESAVEKAEVKNAANKPFYRPFHTFHPPGKLWKGLRKDTGASLFHSLSFQHTNHTNLLYISDFQEEERSLESIFP